MSELFPTRRSLRHRWLTVDNYQDIEHSTSYTVKQWHDGQASNRLNKVINILDIRSTNTGYNV